MTTAADIATTVIDMMNRSDLTQAKVFEWLNLAKDRWQTRTPFRYRWQRLQVFSITGSGMGPPGSALSAWNTNRILLPPRLLRVSGAAVFPEPMSSVDHGLIFGAAAETASNELAWFPSSSSHDEGLSTSHSGPGDLRPYWGSNVVFIAADLADRGVSWEWGTGEPCVFLPAGQDDPSIKRVPKSRVGTITDWFVVKPYTDASDLATRLSLVTAAGYATAAESVLEWFSGGDELELRGPSVEAWEAAPRAIVLDLYSLLPRYGAVSNRYIGGADTFPVHTQDIFTERGDLTEYLIYRAMQAANERYFDAQAAIMWMQKADQLERETHQSMFEEENRQSFAGDAFRMYPGEPPFPPAE